MAQFGVHFGGVGDGAGDFVAEQFAIAFSQAMDGHAGRAFAQAGRRRDVRIGNLVPGGGEELLEPAELAGLARLGKLGAQPRHRQLQQRQRPLAVIDLVRRGAGAGGVGIQGNWRATAAALLGLGLVPFVSEEPLEGGQQERTEAAFCCVGAGDPVVFQQAREKFLGEVLGVVGLDAAAADIGMEGGPVGSAQGGESVAGAGVVASRREDQRPVSGGEDR